MKRRGTYEKYSPQLVNMMLACGPQIEATTKWISHKCGFPEESVPKMIKKINEKKVLSKFRVILIPRVNVFTPFIGELSWWNTYDNLKYNLQEFQLELTYSRVMSAFAALTALHHLARHLNEDNKHMQEILDGDSWVNDSKSVEESRIMILNRHNGKYPIYESSMFEVATILEL